MIIPLAELWPASGAATIEEACAIVTQLFYRMVGAVADTAREAARAAWPLPAPELARASWSIVDESRPPPSAPRLPCRGPRAP